MDDVHGLVAEAEESLKGRLHPPQVLVSNESLVQSSRTQNKTLLLINEKLDGVELSLKKLEYDINARVDAVQASVDDWGKRLTELEKKQQLQDVALEGHERFTRDVNGFKADTNTALGEVKDNIKVLDAALKSMPKTIKASQVLVDGHGDESTAPCVTTIDDCIRDNSQQMKKISLEAAKLIAAMDDIRRETETQADSLQDNLDQVQSSLEGKMSYAECESKIKVHVRRLVDQIKEALLSVEEDEADFKNVANALHAMFNSLKESKADKSEVAHLRSQVISSQLNTEGPSRREGSLDYKGLRKVLGSYCRNDSLDSRLDTKAPKDMTDKRLSHAEHMLDKIMQTVDDIWSAIRTRPPSDDETRQLESLTEVLRIPRRPQTASCPSTQLFLREEATERPFSSPSYSLTPKNQRVSRLSSPTLNLPEVEPPTWVSDRDGNLFLSSSTEDGNCEPQGVTATKGTSQFYEGRAIVM